LAEIEGYLNIHSNDDLETVDGLDALEKIGDRLSIYYCLDLENLNGLSNLDTIVGNCNLDYLSSLVDLTGINNLKSLKTLDMIDLLADVDFGSFPDITNLELLRFWDILELQAIDCFPNLTVVNKLEILANDNLSDFSIIEQLNLDAFTRLNITQNPLFVTCGLNLYCDILSKPFEKDIDNNGPLCELETLMAACCSNGHHDNTVNTWLIESPTPWECNSEARWECGNYWSLSTPPNHCHHAVIPNTANVLVSAGIDNRCQSLTIEADVDFTMESGATLETGQ